MVRVSGRWRVSAGKPKHTCKYGCLWDECVSARFLLVSMELGQLVSRLPVGWVRGARGHTYTSKDP